jgi:hypothetical protein
MRQPTINNIQLGSKMNLLSMNPKLGILATIVTGSILAATFHSITLASPAEHYDRQQMNLGKMQEYMKIRLAKLAERLKIKSSQQAVWEEFSKSVEMLADRNEKKPNADADADAATISRYRADRAAEFANKLSRITDATAKLQAALPPDQRKILDQTAQRFLRHEQGVGHNHRRPYRDENAHGQDRHGAS